MDLKNRSKVILTSGKRRLDCHSRENLMFSKDLNFLKESFSTQEFSHFMTAVTSLINFEIYSESEVQIPCGINDRSRSTC